VPRLEYRERRSPIALAPWVECAWELTMDRSAPSAAHRVLPDGCIDLVWTAEAGLNVVGPNSTAFMAGLPPGSSAVGVRMHPGGAPALLDVCAPALLDARVRPSALWGAPGERLEDQVALAGTPERQATVLLRWLALHARSARADLSVAELAYDGGYADQAHFCHECSALAGTTPSALLAA
jgi:AraC-like DNA-binding protein